MSMNEQEFWSLIELVDIEALHSGDEELANASLIEKLSLMSISEIGAFEEHRCQHLYSLDGKKWANKSGLSRFSSDGFLYARCYVVATGEQNYLRVLGNSWYMPKRTKYWAEGLLSVTASAWSIATGKSEEEFNLHGSVDYETGSNEAQW